jgi:acyl carrier protein
MNRDDIYHKVSEVLVDALAVDEEDVTPEASLVRDLGAESIDFLDIVFKLEKAFGIKVGEGELFPSNFAQDARYVAAGKVTPEGLAALRSRLPKADLSAFEADPSVSKISALFTVEMITDFVERKLAAPVA